MFMTKQCTMQKDQKLLRSRVPPDPKNCFLCEEYPCKNGSESILAVQAPKGWTFDFRSWVLLDQNLGWAQKGTGGPGNTCVNKARESFNTNQCRLCAFANKYQAAWFHWRSTPLTRNLHLHFRSCLVCLTCIKNWLVLKLILIDFRFIRFLCWWGINLIGSSMDSFCSLVQNTLERENCSISPKV